MQRFMSRLDGVMDGTYDEHVALAKMEHLLRGLYHIFQDVSKATDASNSIAHLFTNRLKVNAFPTS